MNPWHILGIEQTSKLEIIKNAYAQKSKLHHPEDEPEQFQKIHEAYRQALKLAKTLPKTQTKQQRIKPPTVHFKRSFYIHKPDENPARAKFYTSEFDEYSKGQLEKFKHENWSFNQSSEPKPKSDTIMSIGKIPIKGSKPSSSQLNFSLINSVDILTDEFIL